MIGSPIMSRWRRRSLNRDGDVGMDLKMTGQANSTSLPSCVALNSLLCLSGPVFSPTVFERPGGLLC